MARRSGLTLEVPGGKTILEVLTAAGVDVPSSCCAGVCATCLTDVISGVPDHRDMVLTADEKASNQRIAVCCSRSLSQTIVLDVWRFAPFVMIAVRSDAGDDLVPGSKATAVANAIEAATHDLS